MNKHAIDADVTRGKSERERERERGRKKNEANEWTGIWSVVYLTRAQIYIEAAAQKVSAYQSNKKKRFALLYNQ